MQKRILAFYSLLMCISLSACGSGAGNTEFTPSGPQAFATSTPRPTSTVIPVSTQIALPTSTPAAYTVVANDTLIGIAARFNITLDELLAANPGIASQTLTIGTVLNIPSPGNITTEPTPTPVAISIQQLRCYATSDGGLWCFALIQNEYAETLENISAWIKLDADTSQMAFAPINILPPGKAIPLAAFFEPQVNLPANPSAQILTAIRVLPGDARYLPAFLQNTLVSIDWQGMTAHVEGQVVLPPASQAANLIWVLGIAYDGAGNVTGIRRWESTSLLPPDDLMAFEFTISSLGAAIARVELLVEARP